MSFSDGVALLLNDERCGNTVVVNRSDEFKNALFAEIAYSNCGLATATFFVNHIDNLLSCGIVVGESRIHTAMEYSIHMTG